MCSRQRRAATNSAGIARWVRSPLTTTRAGAVSAIDEIRPATTAGSSVPKCRSDRWTISVTSFPRWRNRCRTLPRGGNDPEASRACSKPQRLAHVAHLAIQRHPHGPSAAHDLEIRGARRLEILVLLEPFARGKPEQVPDAI